jgi:hypothetical protein
MFDYHHEQEAKHGEGESSEAVARRFSPLPKPVSSSGQLANNYSTDKASDSTLDGLVEAIISVAGERRQTMERLRSALENREDASALALARELVGLGADYGQESDRTDPRLNRKPSCN